MLCYVFILSAISPYTNYIKLELIKISGTATFCFLNFYIKIFTAGRGKAELLFTYIVMGVSDFMFHDEFTG